MEPGFARIYGLAVQSKGMTRGMVLGWLPVKVAFFLSLAPTIFYALVLVHSVLVLSDLSQELGFGLFTVLLAFITAYLGWQWRKPALEASPLTG
jgi:hypothetical protein